MKPQIHKFTAYTLMAATLATAVWFYQKQSQMVPVALEEGSARLTSLGTPKSQKITKDNQNVLLSDTSIRQNWGLVDSKSGINVRNAWEIQKGSHDVVVAVIDTGIDVNHPDLAGNLWLNPGETGVDANGRNKATNGIDDDNNGFIDDVHGWNFVSNNHQLTDNHGHGTHIAGILGADGSASLRGVSPNVSIMVLKYYDPKVPGNNNLKNTIRAIQYAVKMGAHIINYSGGGLDFSQEEFDAVKEARDKGILFVAAAGNERSNSDVAHYYPADYKLDNIISVTAINPNTEVLASSNYGEGTVHIAAPGEGILSTLPGSRYGTMTGTSQATAFVSGVAALLRANNANFDYLQVKKQILATADEISGLRSKTKTSGKLNSYAALAIQPAIPISGLVVTSKSPTFSPTGSGTTGENRNHGIMNLILNKAQRIPAENN